MKIITYNLSVQDVDFTEIANGRYEVNLAIDATKFDSVDGIESPFNMDELISIGRFTVHPSEATTEQIMILESH